MVIHPIDSDDGHGGDLSNVGFFSSTLTQLMAQEDFSTLIPHEIFKSYIICYVLYTTSIHYVLFQVVVGIPNQLPLLELDSYKPFSYRTHKPSQLLEQFLRLKDTTVSCNKSVRNYSAQN
jgi:hypothetical protein